MKKLVILAIAAIFITPNAFAGQTPAKVGDHIDELNDKKKSKKLLRFGTGNTFALDVKPGKYNPPPPPPPPPSVRPPVRPSVKPPVAAANKFPKSSCAWWVVASFGAPWVESVCISADKGILRVYTQRSAPGNSNIEVTLNSSGLGRVKKGKGAVTLHKLNKNYSQTNIHALRATGKVPRKGYMGPSYKAYEGGPRVRYNPKTKGFTGSTYFYVLATRRGWLGGSTTSPYYGFGFETSRGGIRMWVYGRSGSNGVSNSGIKKRYTGYVGAR